MRRASKTDRNHIEIMNAFRKLGWSVCDLSAVGKGCTDLVVGKNNINLMVEVKDGELCPSKRQLNPKQVIWHGSWEGQCCVVKSVDDVIKLNSLA